MRIYHFLFACLLILSASLQWNDPDPALWILAYVIPATLSIISIFAISAEALILLRSVLWAAASITYLVAAFSIFPGFLDEWYNDEVSREAGGLFLIALHSLISYLLVRSEAGRLFEQGLHRTEETLGKTN